MWLFTGNVRLETVRPYACAWLPACAFPPYTSSPPYPPMRPYVRACVYILCVFLPPFVFLLKIMFCNLFVNQSFMKKF
ncbi:hypothetical protein DW157_05590 [Bacteroides eggerthii]|nr:hypothetical protein DW157_05590 [Bacteroides eggerthii]